MQRALTGKTLTGQWSCPTAPAPGRTMNGVFLLHGQDLELCHICSAV